MLPRHMASEHDSEMTLGPGATIAGRYRIEGVLSPSGPSPVYRADDLILGRPVTLRLIPPSLCDDELTPRLELRLARNARLPRADVPALVDLIDLIDLGHDDRGRLLLVTDVYPADSLADLLAREGPLPWPRLRALMVRACQLVHLSHEHGIIRQDLQTRCLYPVRDKADPGTLKVVSPGVFVASGGRVWSCPDPDTALALARYAAPEQISTNVLDRRTDVYALGVILYECITGQVPFADPRPAHVLAAHLIAAPPPFPAAVRRRGVPPEIEAIVARALAKAPEDRWPTIMALANAMATIELGRCEFSGVLETDDVSDLTELLEPQASSTSMRIDAARLSGRAGLAPATGDPAATGEHPWRDVLDTAESTSGLHSPDCADPSAASTITRLAAPGDSTPTLPFGLASDSAARWSTSPSTSPSASPPLRRLAPWAIAAGLALFTAGIVTAVIVNLAQRPAPTAAPTRADPPPPVRPRAIPDPQAAPAPIPLTSPQRPAAPLPSPPVDPPADEPELPDPAGLEPADVAAPAPA